MRYILGEVWLRGKLESGHPIGDTPELRAALRDIFAELDRRHETTAEKLALAAKYIGEGIQDESLDPITREALSYSYSRIKRCAASAQSGA